MDRKFEITDVKGGAALGVRVVTRATSTEIAGVQEDGSLKVRLVASPAGDDAANNELVQFLAEQLRVPVSQIEIVAGREGRDKLISVLGITNDELNARLGFGS